MPILISNVVLLLGVVLGEGVAPVAPASPPPLPESGGGAADTAATATSRAAAQAALARGNRLLKDGDVAGAIAEYQRAQVVYPPAAAKIEFNIAKAEEARGDEPAAAAAFERFLSQSLEIPPEFREEARNELHRLSAALGSLQLAEKRPGLAVIVDGRVHGKTPLDGGLWVRPGRHTVTLEEGDHVLFRDDVDVQGGATLRITVTIATAPPGETASGLPPVSSSPTPASVGSGSPSLLARPMGTEPTAPAGVDRDEGGDRSIWKRWWFWTAAGAAVAVGTTLLILGSRSDCPSHTTCSSVSNLPPYMMTSP